MMMFDELKRQDFALNKTERKIRRKRREKIYVDRSEKLIFDVVQKFLSQEEISYDSKAVRTQSRALAKLLADRFKKYSDTGDASLDVDSEDAFFDALLEKVKH